VERSSCRLLLASVVLALACGACDPEVETLTGANGQGAGVSGTSGGELCSTPGGQRVCQGPNDCSTDDCLCLEDSFGAEPNALGICSLEMGPWLALLFDCPDGTVLLYDITCAPWDLGKLFCDSGASHKVRFLDYGAFDCEPLPEPSDCPETEVLKLCGDACGACDDGELCRGRSRLHPYSFCMPSGVDFCRKEEPYCGEGDNCFVYNVDEVSQPTADNLGICMPAATCAAAEAELPGGGVCYPAEPPP